MAALGMKQAAAAVDPEGPPFPEPLSYLWLWFLKHSMGLLDGGEGHPRITWEGVRAWSVQMRIDLEPWEAELMVMLSHIRVNLHAEWRNQQMKAAMNT